MKLFNVIATSILTQINTTIGANGSIDFFTTTANIPTTGMLNTSSRVKLAANAMNAPTGITTGAADPAGNTSTGAFSAMTTGTVSGAGNAAYFALLNTNTGAGVMTNVLFTGSVGVGTAFDLNFNTTAWSAADNVNITSLNFLAPQG